MFDHFGTLCIKGLILSKTQFSWKFHWDSSSCSEDVKFSSSIITSFINFFNFWFFWHFFVVNKLMTAYNRWCQHFFYFQATLNRLLSNCIKSYWYLITSSWNMKGGTPPQKKKKNLTTFDRLKILGFLWKSKYI